MNRGITVLVAAGCVIAGALWLLLRDSEKFEPSFDRVIAESSQDDPRREAIESFDQLPVEEPDFPITTEDPGLSTPNPIDSGPIDSEWIEAELDDELLEEEEEEEDRRNGYEGIDPRLSFDDRSKVFEVKKELFAIETWDEFYRVVEQEGHHISSWGLEEVMIDRVNRDLGFSKERGRALASLLFEEQEAVTADVADRFGEGQWWKKGQSERLWSDLREIRDEVRAEYETRMVDIRAKIETQVGELHTRLVKHWR